MVRESDGDSESMRKEIVELFEQWKRGAGIVVDTRLVTPPEQEWLEEQMKEAISNSNRRTA